MGQVTAGTRPGNLAFTCFVFTGIYNSGVWNSSLYLYCFVYSFSIYYFVTVLTSYFISQIMPFYALKRGVTPSLILLSETQIFFLSFHHLKFFFLLLSLENKFKLYSWNMNYFKVNQVLIYLPNFLPVASPSIL